MNRLSPLLVVLIALSSAPAWAQGGDNEAATTLFTEGRSALKSGDYDLACDKFEQSLKLDTRVGTLLNLGACNEQRGKLATALRYWKEGLRLATDTHDKRQAVAAKRAVKLEPRVPTLVIVPPEGRTPKVRVVAKGDEMTLSPEQLGSPLTLDSGKYDVLVSWSDGSETRYVVKLIERQQEQLAIAPVPQDEQPATSEPTAPGTAPVKPADEMSSGLGTVRIAGIVIGALGVVGLAVAGGLAGAASSKNGDSNHESDPELCSEATDECGPTGDALRDEAIGLANGATGALVAGAALLGAGLIMVIAAPSDDGETASNGAAPRIAVHAGVSALSVELTW